MQYVQCIVDVFQEFQSPSPGFRPGLSWILNHSLDEESWMRAVRDFSRKGFGRITIQPGPGCLEDTRSAAWRAAIDGVLAEARRLDMDADYEEEAPPAAEAYRPNLDALPRVTSPTRPLSRRSTASLWLHSGSGPSQRATADSPWSLDPQRLLHLGELRLIQGLTALVPHVALDSIAGVRKPGCQPLISSQQPWWPAMKGLCGRLARVAAILSQGETVSLARLDLPRSVPPAQDGGAPDGALPGENVEPSGLVYLHRTVGDGHVFMLLNTSDSRIYSFVPFCFPVRGSAYLGNPDQGTWSVMETFESDGQGGSPPEETLVELEIPPRASALIWIGPQPPCLDERQPLRGGAMVAGLDMPKRFTALPVEASYLPLRDWKLSFQPAERLHGSQTYRSTFSIAEMPSRLLLLLDGLELGDTDIELRCNGCETGPLQGSPYLDPRIPCADLSGLLCQGRNEIELTGGYVPLPLSGPLILAGDFTLQRYEDEWVICAPSTQLESGSWTRQGYPFLSGAMAYRCRLDIPETFRNRHVELEFEGLACAAKVSVDGHEAGWAAWSPWRLALPALQEPGPHDLTIEVVNTLANLFSEDLLPSGILGDMRLNVS